jgi:hypothetical protein
VGSARRAPAANEQHPTCRAVAVPPVVVDPGPAVGELDLAEFVVDDDDYPEVAADRGRTPPPTAAVPDRVDDIDDWLEEFAVEDCWDASPR